MKLNKPNFKRDLAWLLIVLVVFVLWLALVAPTVPAFLR